MCARRANNRKATRHGEEEFTTENTEAQRRGRGREERRGEERREERKEKRGEDGNSGIIGN
jgi:hypothetical protein